MNKTLGILLLISMLLSIAFSTSGCAKTGVCAECGQTEKLTKYVLQGNCGNLGDKGKVEYMCDDCIRIAKLTGY